MYNSLGDANFTGKYKGIPLKANSITESLIEIVIDNKKVSFKKGDKIAVTKKVQSIINKILDEDESEQKKDNTRIKKFVDSLNSEFKSVKIMPTKKKVTKKAVAPRKKVTVKKAVAPRKKVTVKKAVAPKKRTKKSIYLDSLRPAKKAGKRISAEGNVYYEYRPNRTDVKPRAKKGQMLGINNIDSKKYALKEFNNSLNNIKGFEILIQKINKIIIDNKVTKKYSLSAILDLKKELKKSKELLKEHKLHSKELKKFL